MLRFLAVWLSWSFFMLFVWYFSYIFHVLNCLCSTLAECWAFFLIYRKKRNLGKRVINLIHKKVCIYHIKKWHSESGSQREPPQEKVTRRNLREVSSEISIKILKTRSLFAIPSKKMYSISILIDWAEMKESCDNSSYGVVVVVGVINSLTLIKIYIYIYSGKH